MTYEFCVFDPAYAPDLGAARKAWDVTRYHDDSQPDSQREARKWQIKDALAAFNEDLQFLEPKPPPRGLLGKLKSGDEPQPYLLLSGWYAQNDEYCTNYHVYDRAVEVSLPWEAPADVAQAVMREAWRHLEHLSRQGWNVIYDTERDALLDLASDFEAVMQQYLRNIESDIDAREPQVEPTAAPLRDRPQAHVAAAPIAADKPFTGNVSEARKPWWKVW